MNDNSESKKSFDSYYKKEKERNPNLQIIRQEDLVPMNEPSCPHKTCHLDETETDFDVMVCNQCGLGAVFPFGTFRSKFDQQNKTNKEK